MVSKMVSTKIKNIFVAEKNFENKVEGWINCDQLEAESSRDGILEGNDVYTQFNSKLQNRMLVY
jgi:hypothetical protein